MKVKESGVRVERMKKYATETTAYRTSDPCP
jgi:hypothetical protein